MSANQRFTPYTLSFTCMDQLKKIPTTEDHDTEFRVGILEMVSDYLSDGVTRESVVPLSRL